MRLLLTCALCALWAPCAMAAPAKPAPLPAATADLRQQLSRAIAANDAADIARLMKRGARPDAVQLSNALYGAKLTTWKALLDNGLSLNAPVEVSEDAEFSAKAPMIVAVASLAATDESPNHRSRALLRELIARGADVNARAQGGPTALRAATEYARDNGESARILVNAGARVAPDDAWMLASAARTGDVAALQRALKLGVSATSAAARNEHLLQAALDLRRFEDDNETGFLNYGTPSFTQAKNADRARVVALLLDAGVSPDDIDAQGVTPLMLAADGGLRPDLVELLLKHGADPNLRNAKSPTIWDYAAPTRRFTARQIENGLAYSIEAFGWLRTGDNAFVVPTSAQILARQTPEDLRTIALLLDAGAPIEQTNARGETLLMLVAKANRAATIKFLLARGANSGATDNAGNSALHIAAGTDSPDAIGALLDAGANIEARNANDLTPLLMAAGAGVTGVTSYAPFGVAVEGYSGGPEALRALAVRGANVNARAGKGVTALHLMAQHGDTKSAQLLVKRGADINARGANGATALHIAAREGDYSMAKLLLQLGAEAQIKAQGLTPLDLARQPYQTKMNVVGEDPNYPSRETLEMRAQFAKSDRQITARRLQIAELLKRFKA